MRRSIADCCAFEGRGAIGAWNGTRKKIEAGHIAPPRSMTADPYKTVDEMLHNVYDGNVVDELEELVLFALEEVPDVVAREDHEVA